MTRLPQSRHAVDERGGAIHAENSSKEAGRARGGVGGVVHTIALPFSSRICQGRLCRNPQRRLMCTSKKKKAAENSTEGPSRSRQTPTSEPLLRPARFFNQTQVHSCIVWQRCSFFFFPSSCLSLFFSPFATKHYEGRNKYPEQWIDPVPLPQRLAFSLSPLLPTPPVKSSRITHKKKKKKKKKRVFLPELHHHVAFPIIILSIVVPA